MRKSVKLIALFLSLAMLAWVLPLFAVAKQSIDKSDKVTIFVEGINTVDIIDTETGKTVWPPEASTIVGAVAENLPALTEFLLTQDVEKLREPLVNAVVSALAGTACDENGVPSANTVADWEYPTEDEIWETFENQTETRRITFAYDWRLDIRTLAEQLHDFIEYVMDIVGVESVDMVAFSMGTAVAATYLKIYDYEYIDNITFMSGGFMGSSCCGEPFSNELEVNAEASTRYVESVMLNTTEELDDILINALLQKMNKTGATQKLLDYIYNLAQELTDEIYQGVVTKTFGTFPGLWAMIPSVNYDNAKNLLGDSLSPQFIDLIDWYHYEVQDKLPEILQGCLDRGLNFGIIAQYGYGMFPCIDSINTMSDSVIDTKYESVGATAADVGSDLGYGYVQKIDNGHNCISPDNMIDSSTCLFCDYTWFIKNSRHGENLGVYMKVCRYILDSEKQVTVWDGVYPQYLTAVNGVPVELTKENCQSDYTEDFSEVNDQTILYDMYADTVVCLKYLIQS